MRSEMHDNLAKSLNILSKDAQLSITARQRVRDSLFKKMGQLDLIDAVQTNTPVPGLILPLGSLLAIFKPRRIALGVPATAGIALAVLLLSFTTGVLAQSAQPGSGIFYTVRRAMEEVQIALATDPTKKAEIKLAIASDRVQSLTLANQSMLPASIQESRKALASAQVAVKSLTDQAKSDPELATKLADLINTQKTLLTGIITDEISDAEVKQGIIALRDEINSLLPATTEPGETISDTSDPTDVAVTEPTIVEPTEPVYTNEIQSFYGSLTTSFGQLAINTGSKVYVLRNLNLDLSKFIGASQVQVVGILTPDGIAVSKIFIDNKLVGEGSSKINSQNLPGVDDE